MGEVAGIGAAAGILPAALHYRRTPTRTKTFGTPKGAEQ